MMSKTLKYALISVACVTFSAFICVLTAALFIGKVVAFLVPICLAVVFSLIWLVLSVIPFVKKLVGLKIGIVAVCALTVALILIF